MKPWERNWNIKNKLSSGGQGTTKLVERVNKPNSELFVLKILNRQKDLERRKRMYREAAVLKTLSHPGIPALIDHNTDQYENLSVHLFLVTQYIPGSPLEEKIRSGGLTHPLPLNESLTLAKRLIEIVQYCHDNEVGHRDIKPDNIILRNDNFSDPVLIDFGQTFKQSIESNKTTKSQQMGNRFLALPEHSVDYSNKRDIRSDLSACVGILFFVLTGEYPRTFLDEKGAKPHQRQIAKQRLEKIESKTQSALHRIFDQAFEPSIERRFQSAQAILLELESLNQRSVAEEGKTLEQMVEDFILKQNKSIEITHKRGSKMILKNTLELISAGCCDAIQRLGNNDFNSAQTNQYIKLDALEAGTEIGIVNELDPIKVFWPQMKAVITGAELVIMGIFNGVKNELVRLPLEACMTQENRLMCRSNIKDYYLKGFLKVQNTL